MSPGASGRRFRLALLVLLCAAPHVVRLFGATHVPHDGFYGHAAFMLARGHEPYTEFTQVAFPLAETVLSWFVYLFGHSTFVVEMVNNLVIAAVAMVLYAAGRRLAGPRAGVTAALAWCWSLWVIHFNLFERETWAALGTSLALLAYASAPERPRRRVAAALLLGFLVKITALMAAAGIALHLIVRGRLRQAVQLLALYLLGIGLATLLGWALWGDPFLWQVYLFGFFRNWPGHSLGTALNRLFETADPTTLLGLGALVAIGLPRLRRTEGVLACVLVAQLTYALAVNPVLWEHNVIDFAPACALLAGILVAELPRARLQAAVALAIAVGILLASGGAWLHGSYGPAGPGFGGWPKETLANRATFLQRHSAPDEIVVTMNPWWSFEAGRVEFVRYDDLQQTALGIEASLAADGWFDTFAKRQGPLLLGPGLPPHDPRAEAFGPYLGRQVATGLAYTRPLFLAAIARHEIGLVMEPLPPALLTEADLTAAGYERFADHELGVSAWRPAGGVSHPVVSTIYGR